MNCRFWLQFVSVFAILEVSCTAVSKFRYNTDDTVIYDIVLLTVFQLVRIILQTTFFIQRFNIFLVFF